MTTLCGSPSKQSQSQHSISQHSISQHSISQHSPFKHFPKHFIWCGPVIHEEGGLAYYQSVDVTDRRGTVTYSVGDTVYFQASAGPVAASTPTSSSSPSSSSSSATVPSSSSSTPFPGTPSSSSASRAHVGEITNFYNNKLKEKMSVGIRWFFRPCQVRDRTRDREGSREGQREEDRDSDRVLQSEHKREGGDGLGEYDEGRDVFLSDECDVQPIQAIIGKCRIKYVTLEDDCGFTKAGSYHDKNISHGLIADSSSSSSYSNSSGRSYSYDSTAQRESDWQAGSYLLCRHYYNAGQQGVEREGRGEGKQGSGGTEGKGVERGRDIVTVTRLRRCCDRSHAHGNGSYDGEDNSGAAYVDNSTDVSDGHTKTDEHVDSTSSDLGNSSSSGSSSGGSSISGSSNSGSSSSNSSSSSSNSNSSSRTGSGSGSIGSSSGNTISNGSSAGPSHAATADVANATATPGAAGTIVKGDKGDKRDKRDKGDKKDKAHRGEVEGAVKKKRKRSNSMSRRDCLNIAGKSSDTPVGSAMTGGTLGELSRGGTTTAAVEGLHTVGGSIGGVLVEGTAAGATRAIGGISVLTGPPTASTAAGAIGPTLGGEVVPVGTSPSDDAVVLLAYEILCRDIRPQVTPLSSLSSLVAAHCSILSLPDVIQSPLVVLFSS